MSKIYHFKSNNGFTLIELLVVIAISGVLLTAIYSAFQWQHKNYHVQEQVAEMQQNLRAAMDIMSMEIRMAGYDPTGSGNFGITNAAFNFIKFTSDMNDNGNVDSNETISYSLYDFDSDSNLDLARDDGSGRQLLAENIEYFGLAYAYDKDLDGNLEINSSNDVIWAIDTNNDGNLDYSIFDNSPISPVALDRIRAVRIWILAKADKEDPDFQNTNTYVIGNQVITPNDKFRRRLLTGIVHCRNMGL